MQFSKELSDEEEESSEGEKDYEYFPPAGLLIPGFYAPPNDVAKTNGLAILFPTVRVKYCVTSPLAQFVVGLLVCEYFLNFLIF